MRYEQVLEDPIAAQYEHTFNAKKVANLAVQKHLGDIPNLVGNDI